MYPSNFYAARGKAAGQGIEHSEMNPDTKGQKFNNVQILFFFFLSVHLSFCLRSLEIVKYSGHAKEVIGSLQAKIQRLHFRRISATKLFSKLGQ
jgi:hypothetical protein